MRNLLIVCNPGRVDAVVAAVELQQNLASTFGIYTISDVNIPGMIRSTIADLPEIEAGGGSRWRMELCCAQQRLLMSAEFHCWA
jgi:hypothetical protein